jgi:NO-binding membrane sensor protein with MHYT domain
MQNDGPGAVSFLHCRLLEPSKRESMIKVISAALIAGGVVLLYFGGQSFHSFANDMSRVFTGAPTNKTIWLIAGGVVATLAGIVGLTASSGKR